MFKSQWIIFYILNYSESFDDGIASINMGIVYFRYSLVWQWEKASLYKGYTKESSENNTSISSQKQLIYNLDVCSY